MGTLIIDEEEYIFSPNFGIFFCRGYHGYIPTGMLMKIKTPMCFVDQLDNKYRFIDYTGWSYSFGKTINTIDIMANVHNMDRHTRYYTTNQFKQNNTGELFQQMTKNQKITIYYFFQDVGGGGGGCLFLDAIDYGDNTKEKSSSDVKRNNDDYENFEKRWEEKSNSSEKKTSNNSDNENSDKYNNRKNSSKESYSTNDQFTPYCELLGLKRPFTHKELKAARDKAIKEKHPDHHVNSSESDRIKAEEFTKQINEAYEILEEIAQ